MSSMEAASRDSMEEMVTIEIFGQEFIFRTEGDDREFAREAAKMLSQDLQDAQNRLRSDWPGIPNLSILVLVALNIAGEYLKLKKNHEETISRIQDGTDQLVRKFDRKSE